MATGKFHVTLVALVLLRWDSAGLEAVLPSLDGSERPACLYSFSKSLQTPKWSCYLGEASGSIKETYDYALQSLRLFLCCGEVSFDE